MNENFGKSHADMWSDMADGHGEIHNILGNQGYITTCDFPAAVYWREQMVRYPDAKLILTYRDPEVWYKSFMSTIANMQPDNKACPFGVRVTFAMGLPCKGAAAMLHKVITRDCFNNDWSKENIIAQYIAHIEDVRASCVPEKLLIWEVSQGWKPLCAFLNVPEPDIPFPHENTTIEYQRFVSTVNALGISMAVGGLGEELNELISQSNARSLTTTILIVTVLLFF